MIKRRECGGGFSVSYDDEWHEICIVKDFPDDPKTGMPRSVCLLRTAEIIREADKSITEDEALKILMNAYDKIDLSELEGLSIEEAHRYINALENDFESEFR